MPNLTIRKCEDMGDWYVIERAEAEGEHREWMERTAPNCARFMSSARLSDADVEGQGVEILNIAAAIETRAGENHKRCAVKIFGDSVYLWSPRNSNEEPEPVTLAEADDLARQIRAMVTPVPVSP